MSETSSNFANDPAKNAAGLFISLCVVSLLNTSTIAFAQEREDAKTGHDFAALHTDSMPAFDPAALPSLASIDMHTDISVFLRKGVPEKLTTMALRRAWSVDPAIRDFRGLEENAWNFNDPNSIPGFGELGHEVDFRVLLTNLFSRPARVPVRLAPQPSRLYSYLFSSGRSDARELAHE
jgi:hypothetical protein